MSMNTRVARRPGFPGKSQIQASVSRVPAQPSPGTLNVPNPKIDEDWFQNHSNVINCSKSSSHKHKLVRLLMIK